MKQNSDTLFEHYKGGGKSGGRRIKKRSNLIKFGTFVSKNAHFQAFMSVVDERVVKGEGEQGVLFLQNRARCFAVFITKALDEVGCTAETSGKSDFRYIALSLMQERHGPL